MKTIALIYVILVVVMSVVTFCVYGWDKRQAKTDGWRIPEKRFHWLSLMGWPGAIYGQRFFRHKTQKTSFKIMTWFAITVHVILAGAFVYFWLG